MNILDTDPHMHSEGLPWNVSKDQGCELPRIDKIKNPSESTKKREMDTQLIEFSAIFNSEQTRAELSKCILEQIAKAFRRGSVVDNLRETVLNIQKIIYVLS